MTFLPELFRRCDDPGGRVDLLETELAAARDALKKIADLQPECPTRMTLKRHGYETGHEELAEARGLRRASETAANALKGRPVR